MTLKVLLPTRILLETTAEKVTAEGREGHFCLLPQHVDLVAPLVPGVLGYEEGSAGPTYIGIDEGVLVKTGDTVLVSTRQATEGGTLAELTQRVEAEFQQPDEHERHVRSATARLEAGLVRRFLDIREQELT